VGNRGIGTDLPGLGFQTIAEPLSSQSYAADQANATRAIGAVYSGLENSVLEEVQNLEAASTMKGFQIALNQTQPSPILHFEPHHLTSNENINTSISLRMYRRIYNTSETASVVTSKAD